MRKMTFRPVPKPKFKRRVPTRKQRGRFSKKVREQILKDENYQCQSCGRRATQIHHVKPKGSGNGRGVYTNGMAVCNSCHTKIHDDNDLLRYWQRLYESEYGPDYYKDRWDD